MRKNKYLILLCACIYAIGCLPAGYVEPRVISLVPGECLKSNTLLSPEEPPAFNIGNYSPYPENRAFIMRFDLDLDDENEAMKRAFGVGFATEVRYKPSASVYKEFGWDSEKVKKSYEYIYNEYRGSIPEVESNLTTIYYTGKMSLTADKPFAGIPAGNDLSSILIGPKDLVTLYPIPTVEIPDGYFALPRVLTIRIPVGDFKEVEEKVGLHLEIPVKVGLLLHLLDDRLGDPWCNKMQFRDEVLTCDFTIPKSLQPE